MNNRWCVIGVMLFLISGSVPRLASAQPTNSKSEQQARLSFERAEAYFRAGLFAEALAAYRAGYNTHALPEFLINIAQCQRRLGDLPKARATYQEFILAAPDSRFVPEVKALMAELDDLMKSAEGEAVTGDGKQESLQPKQLGEPASLLHPKGTPMTAQASPASNLWQVSAVPTAPNVARTSRTRWWLWGTLGVAALGVVAVIVIIPPKSSTLHEGSLGTLRR